MLKEGIIIGERYEIISRVGSGGMADVYKAMDHKLNRMVAVKILKAEFRQDTGFIARFRKEAQSAAGLAHPNIVNVYDVGEDRGLYYIVMELVEGITLKNYIMKKGKLSVKEATSIAIQVSLGLEAAHNQDIVHRDVKPQNIIISTDGKVKLSDFGIAKASNSNTITANVMGSVHYSSPEQVRGGFADAKSDIYSLGITMYEMVTGRVPFDGDTTVAIAIKHLQEEIIPPSRYASDLPYSLEQIILKCTQKNPERRYENVGGLIDDLKQSLVNPQGDFVKIEAPAIKTGSGEAPSGGKALKDPITKIGGSSVNRGGKEEPERRRTSETERRQSAENRRKAAEEDRRRRRFDDDEEDEEYDSGRRRRRFDEDEEDFASGKKRRRSRDDDEEFASARKKSRRHAADYDEDDDAVSSKLEKAITIGGFVIGAVIIVILIIVIGNLTGLFGKKSTDTTATSGDSAVITVIPTQTNETTVEVPDFSGNTMEQAADLAAQYGLSVMQTGTQNSEAYTEGLIIYQETLSGTVVPTGSVINVVVSAGSSNTTIPTGLVGATQTDVENILASVGLSVVAELVDSDMEAGRITAVNPNEGTAVTPGSEVHIYVSKGPTGSTQTSDGTTSAASSIADNSTVNANSSMVCTVDVYEPGAYMDGDVTIVLVQNGVNTVVYAGERPWTDGGTPVTLTFNGANGVTTGTLQILDYEGDLIGTQEVEFTAQ